MQKKYTLGKRFDRLWSIGTAVVCALTIMFYFIYQMLFEHLAPQFVGWPMLILFVCIALALSQLMKLIGKKLKGSHYYIVGEDSFMIVTGKNVRKLLWKDFTAAEVDTINNLARLPAAFTVDGKKLTLNQYMGSLFELGEDMLDHIQGHANIDPELRRKVTTMKGIYD